MLTKNIIFPLLIKIDNKENGLDTKNRKITEKFTPPALTIDNIDPCSLIVFYPKGKREYLKNI